MPVQSPFDPPEKHEPPNAARTDRQTSGGGLMDTLGIAALGDAVAWRALPPLEGRTGFWLLDNKWILEIDPGAVPA